MSHTHVVGSAAAVLLIVQVMIASAQTPDELSIVPPRVVFMDGGKGSETLTLRNRGVDTLSYELYVANYRMSDTGTFEEVTEPDSGQRFAGEYLKFTPHDVTLAPNGEAAIRITCSRTPERPPGEYRSHLVIRLERRRHRGSSSDAEDDQTYGVAVPVIIRQGELLATVNVAYLNVDLVPESDSLPSRAVATARLERTGDASTYGDVSIWYVKRGGAPVLVGSARGIALYTPNRWRILHVPLQLPPGRRLEAGLLRLEYRDRSGPEGLLLAQIEVPVE